MKDKNDKSIGADITDDEMADDEIIENLKETKENILAPLPKETLDKIWGWVSNDLKSFTKLRLVNKEFDKHIVTYLQSQDSNQERLKQVFKLLFEHKKQPRNLHLFLGKLYGWSPKGYFPDNKQDEKQRIVGKNVALSYEKSVNAVYACILRFYFAHPAWLKEQLKIKTTLLYQVAECFEKSTLDALKLPREIQALLESNPFFIIAMWKYRVMHAVGSVPPVPDGARDFLGRNLILGCNLNGLKLGGVNLGNSDLQGANLADTNLVSANLKGANLRRANLKGANLEEANLEEAELQGANLASANLKRAKLVRGVNLEEANLTDANLEEAKLPGVNLASANLNGANLRRAYLSRVNLAGADLTGTDLTNANLTGANLRGADISEVVFTNAQLSGVRWDDNHAKTITLDQLTQMRQHLDNFEDEKFSAFFEKSVLFQLTQLEKNTDKLSTSTLLALLDNYMAQKIALDQLKQMREDPDNFNHEKISGFFEKSLLGQLTQLEKNTDKLSAPTLLPLLENYMALRDFQLGQKSALQLFSFLKAPKAPFAYSKNAELADGQLLKESMKSEKPYETYEKIPFNGAANQGTLGRINKLWQQHIAQLKLQSEKNLSNSNKKPHSSSQ